MTTPMSPSKRDQGGLFDTPKPVIPDDDEPKSNSPEDLGLGPPRGGSYGRRSQPPGGEERAAKRVNMASGTIGRPEAVKLIAWLNDQEFEVHEDVTVGHILVDLSGSTPDGFAWLCRACKQAGQAPEPWRMNKALRARDVSLLRERPD